jgi:hypothetical protein
MSSTSQKNVKKNTREAMLDATPCGETMHGKYKTFEQEAPPPDILEDAVRIDPEEVRFVFKFVIKFKQHAS